MESGKKKEDKQHRSISPGRIRRRLRSGKFLFRISDITIRHNDVLSMPAFGFPLKKRHGATPSDRFNFGLKMAGHAQVVAMDSKNGPWGSPARWQLPAGFR